MNRTTTIVASLILGLAFIAGTNAQTATSPADGPKKTENVQPSFRQEGIASWYGAEFEGKPTASGERFDSRDLTAAHPSLPFGTLITVTNQHNNARVVVRVNDRGPFVSTRILDLSRAAAEKLDMIVTGTAPVVVELAAASVTGDQVALALSTTPKATTPAMATGEGLAQAPAQVKSPPARIMPMVPDPSNGKKYRLQVGSFKLARNATEAFDKLKAVGLSPSYEKNGDLYRVVVPMIPSAEIVQVAESMGAAGFLEVLAREER
jgi:rare lipoprotein A